MRKRRLSVSEGGARQCSWVQPRRPLGDEARAGKTDRSVGSGSPHLGLLEDSLTWGGGGRNVEHLWGWVTVSCGGRVSAPRGQGSQAGVRDSPQLVF